MQKFNLVAFIKDKKGKILSVGKNSYIKTHPMMYKIALHNGNLDPKKIYIHAEIDAIIKCRHLDTAYSLEVYRVSKSGKYLNSKPCPICMSGIKNTCIKKIGYIDINGQYVETFL